jgi:hypothetical protein
MSVHKRKRERQRKSGKKKDKRKEDIKQRTNTDKNSRTHVIRSISIAQFACPTDVLLHYRCYCVLYVQENGYVSMILCQLNLWDTQHKVSHCCHVRKCLVTNSTQHNVVDRDSVIGIATPCGMDSPGIEARWKRDFLHRPDPLWGRPSLLYNR